MLTDKERAFAKELLEYLETEDLLSLTKTTTNDVVVPKSRNDAVSAIILHSESIHALLGRKKITKEILFKFLHDRQQSVSITEQRDNLKKRVLGLVGIRGVRTVRFDDNPGNESDDSGAGSEISLSEDLENPELSSTQASVHVNRSTTQETTQASSSGVLSQEVLTDADSQAVLSATQLDNQQQSSNVVAVQQEFPVAEFSQQFVTWFFELLNSGSVSPDHFWSDASAEFLIKPEDKVSRAHAGDGVSQLLAWFKEFYNITFNPNVSGGGVQGILDAHGLMVVYSCGTIHTPERCVGVFTQQFSLARDPFANNNWKVKNMKAIFRCQGYELDLVAEGMPRLDGPYSDMPMLM